jgi:hypothetical protein
VYNLLANTLWSTVVDPVHCRHSGASRYCEAYVLSGGLSKIVPWNPSGYPEYSVIRAENVPTVHIEFHGNGESHPIFETKDCDIFASNSSLIGVKFCVSLANSTAFQTGESAVS